MSLKKEARLKVKLVQHSCNTTGLPGRSVCCSISPHCLIETQKTGQITEERWAQPEEEWTTIPHSRSHGASSSWRRLNEASCTDKHTPHYQRGGQPGVLENGCAHLDLDPGAVGEKSEDSNFWSHADNQEKTNKQQSSTCDRVIHYRSTNCGFSSVKIV